jgi:hypothetical protein
MVKHIAAAGVLWTASAHVVAAGAPAADSRSVEPNASSMEADAMKLCERLAGTERDICVRQARENRNMADPTGPGGPGGAAGQAPAPQPGNDRRSR